MKIAACVVFLLFCQHPYQPNLEEAKLTFLLCLLLSLSSNLFGVRHAKLSLVMFWCGGHGHPLFVDNNNAIMLLRRQPKFTFSHFTRDPNLQITKFTWDPNLHITKFTQDPNLHNIKFTRNLNLHKKFTQHQICTDPNLHKNQIYTDPKLTIT